MKKYSSQSITAATLLEGRASGQTLVLTEPMNAWGGLDPDTGRIVHHSHPQRGADITGKVLVMEETRGSGTNAQILAQTWAEGHGPIAIILARPDYVLCVGAVVSQELYGIRCPVVVVGRGDYNNIEDGVHVEVDARSDAAIVAVGTTASEAAEPGL